MKNLIKSLISLSITLFIIFSSVITRAETGNPKAEEEAQKTISTFKEKNKKMDFYFEDSYAYVVFPKITKAGISVGGAAGKGIVFKCHQIVGTSKLKQVSVGFQLGAQQYSEIIFFSQTSACT